MSKEEKFLALAKQYEKASDELNALRTQLTAAMLEIGFDKYIQDPETGIVYKTVSPNGTFVYYRAIDYKRTAKEGEKGGVVLSKKEAQEAGFTL